MTIPELVKNMQDHVKPISYDGDIVRKTPMVMPGTVDLWVGWLQDAYMRLVSEFAKLSHGLDWHTPANCDGRTPSEEYLKEYAKTYDFKYPTEEGDDAWLEDAGYDMDWCIQCDNPDCENVKLRKLVSELKEGLTCRTC